MPINGRRYVPLGSHQKRRRKYAHHCSEGSCQKGNFRKFLKNTFAKIFTLAGKWYLFRPRAPPTEATHYIIVEEIVQC